MRFIPEKIFNVATFYILAIYVLLLNWSPYASAFTAYTVAGVMLLKALFCNVRDFRFIKRIEVYLFATPAFLYLIGMFYSQSPAFKELLTVAPIFAYSFGLASFKPLDKRQFKWVILLFIFSTTALAVTNFVYFELTKTLDSDIREMSLTMSHIRFSLICNIAIMSSIYFIFWESNRVQTIIEKCIFWSGLLLLIPYLFIQQSLAGIGTLAVCVTLVLVMYTYRGGDRKKARIFWSAFLVVCCSILSIALYEISFFIFPDKKPEIVALNTVNGNPYTFTLDPNQLENGHYTYLYYCPEELIENWSLYSNMPLGQKDNKNQFVFGTIIRYLTSKNLSKDSVGLASLTVDDIHNIENGITNYRFSNSILPNSKFYTFFWEIYGAINGNSPSGHSAVQRIAFQQTSLQLIRDYFWFGYGTANLVNALQPYYEQSHSPLLKKYWFAPHNQFISFFCMFGVVGFAIILASYYFLVKKARIFSSYFKSIHFTIIVLSMLFEDTMSTQAGIVLYGFFGGLFLFGTEDEYFFNNKSS